MDIMKNTIKIKLAGMILSVALASVPGCGTSVGFVNPFAYLSNIVSVDNTSFFVDLYTALIQSGMNVTATDTTNTTGTTTTGTTTTGTTTGTIPGLTG
jgi:hypothetical protein